MRKLLLLLLLFSLVYLSSCVFSDDDPNNSSWSWTPNINPSHTLLGTPFDGDSTDEYFIQRNSYTISYNYELNVANWVCWNLNKSWLGNVSRYSGDFVTDYAIPPGNVRVNHDDYKFTGYDRGHLVASSERTATDYMNFETFFLTNIYPQKPDMNQGVWSDFESYYYNLAKYQDKDLYIIAGGIFTSNARLNNIVAIPDTCYKIVLILDMGESISDIDSTTQVIAVKIPNIDGIRNANWIDYKCNVDAIESSTGFDYMNLIPDSLENHLESYVF